MSDISLKESIPVAGRSANTLAAEIIAITSQTRQMVVMSAIEVGRRLEEAKALVDHGEWGTYIETECQLSHRSANNCMKLFREWHDNPNSQALANLSYTNAIRLLSLPDDERDQFTQEHDVANMSSRELERAIKDSRAAADAAEAKNRELEQALMDAHKQTESAMSSDKDQKAEIARLSESLNSAKQEVSKAKDQIQHLKDHPDIPKATIAKLQKEAQSMAESQVQEQIRAKLEEAERKIAEANQAAADAEKKAEAAQQALSRAEKSSVFSDSDSKAILNQADLWKEDFNRMVGHLKKLALKSPDRAAEFKTGIQKMVAAMAEAVK